MRVSPESELLLRCGPERDLVDEAMLKSPIERLGGESAGLLKSTEAQTLRSIATVLLGKKPI